MTNTVVNMFLESVISKEWCVKYSRRQKAEGRRQKGKLCLARVSSGKNVLTFTSSAILSTFDFRLLYRYAVAFLIVGGILSCYPALAAERVVLKYRIFRESIAVEDLTNFASTGAMSADLRGNLALARQDPQKIRQSLTNTVTVDPILLDRVLNNPVGEFLLDEIGKTVHPPSRQANRQALRAAVILSARDRQLSLLEILQNYPTTEVEVEGDRLEAVYSQLRRLQGNLENIL